MKRLVRLALPLVGAVLLAACGTSPEEHLALARAAFAKSDYQTARTQLGQALKADPRNREMLLLLVQTQLLLGDGDGAQGGAERLRAIGLTGPEIARIEAEAALLRGKPDKVLELLGNDGAVDAWRIRAAAHLALEDSAAAQAAFAAGNRAGSNYRLACDYTRFLIQSGDLATASTQFEALRRSRAEALEVLMLGGALSEAYARQELAAKYYARAAQLYPFRFEPLLAHANLLDMLGKVPDAARLAESAAAIAPGDAGVQQALLSVYSQQGKWDKIRDMLQRREDEMDPASAEGLSYAEALLRLGHPEQARAQFAQALLVQPQNRYIRMMLGESQLATGDAASAWETLRPLAQGLFVQPREIELAVKAGQAAGAEEADELQARVKSSAFQQQQAVLQAAIAADARGDWARALRLYQQLAGGSPADAELLRRMALAASQAGQPALALASADKALALDPQNPELRYAAGMVRLRAGQDLAAARQHLQAAVDARPDNPQYRVQLTKAKAAAG